MHTPQTGATLQGTTAQVLNTVKSTMSADFQASVGDVIEPNQVLADGVTATYEEALMSVRAFGQALIGNQTWKNDFLTALINRIGLVLITSKSYENPWKAFKRGQLDYGDNIEDIFVDICKPHMYSAETAETEVEKREIPDVKVALYRTNSEVFYKQTIQDRELEKAFMSFDGVSNMLTGIVTAMYTSMEMDERLAMKYVIVRRMVDGTMGKMTLPSSSDASAIIKAVKTVSNLLMTPSRKYNQAQVTNFARKDQQYVFVTSEFDAVSGVEVLAKAFNVDYVQFSGQYIVLDTFTFTDEEQDRLDVILGKDPEYRRITATEMQALAKVNCIMVDNDFFMVFDKLIEFTNRLNQQGLYNNNWLHVWKVYASGNFANAVMFTEETSTVNTVTVSPATATMSKNSTLQMTATVDGSAFADKTVTWSVSGTGASITDDGLLVLDNTATGSITVTATSRQDSEKTGQATITIG